LAARSATCRSSHIPSWWRLASGPRLRAGPACFSPLVCLPEGRRMAAVVLRLRLVCPTSANAAAPPPAIILVALTSMRNYLLFLLIFLGACHAKPPLRVGTTGDYPPFSVWTGAEPSGTDITMARAFAKAQGRDVVFVRTSWNNLLDDLRADWFSLAISGITV